MRKLLLGQKKQPRICWGILLIALLLSLGGCAYRWGEGERMVPGGYKNITVPVFENRSHETGIEVYFTNAMIEEIDRSRSAHVTSKQRADVAVEGTIQTVKYVPGAQKSSASTNNLPANTVLTAEYRILITTLIRVRHLSDNRILWSASFSGEKSYISPQVESAVVNSVNSLYNHSAHHQNITLMAQEMMTEAFQQMTENF
jgi:hypothetical protein